MDDSALSAFIEAEVGELLDASEPVQVATPVAVEPVHVAAEPAQTVVETLSRELKSLSLKSCNSGRIRTDTPGAL